MINAVLTGLRWCPKKRWPRNSELHNCGGCHWHCRWCKQLLRDLVNTAALEITRLSSSLDSFLCFKTWDGGVGRGSEAPICCLGPKSRWRFHVSVLWVLTRKRRRKCGARCVFLSRCRSHMPPQGWITEPCLHSLLPMKAPAEQFLFTILTLLLSISTEDIKREDGLCSWMRAIWLSISREWQIPSDVVSCWAFSEARFCLLKAVFSSH